MHQKIGRVAYRTLVSAFILHLIHLFSFHLIVPTYESIKLLGTSESYMKSGKS